MQTLKMIVLRSIVLLQAISIVTLIYTENVYCACPISDGNVSETLNNTCDWSKWLQWNCSACYNQNGKAALPVRKRAICCEKGLDVTACLKSCNYSQDSDTNYGNCSTHCATLTTKTTITTTTTAITTSPAAITIKTATTTSPAAITIKTATTTSPAAITIKTAITTSPAAITIKTAITTSPAAITIKTATTTTARSPAATTTTSPTAKTTTYRRVTTGAIVGVVTGCIGGLLIVAGVILWFRKKFKVTVEPEPERLPEVEKSPEMVLTHD